MNTKMTTFVSTLALILATSASAQVVSGSIVTAVPLSLPSPLPNVTPLILPAPSISPAVALTLAPALSAPAIPVMPILPATPVARVVPIMPVLPTNPAARGHNALPIMPVTQPKAIPFSMMRDHLLAASKDAADKDAVAAAKLDSLFDGSTPAEKTADEKDPVRSDRHHSLPENDLEKEIGAY